MRTEIRGNILGWSQVAPQANERIWNQLPAAMIVRFDTPTEWQIEGLPPKTLPIAPIRATWYLDIVAE